MMTPYTTPRSRRGFTLIEVLIAIGISSFLLSALFFVMTSSSRMFRVQTDISQVTARMGFAMDEIKNDLRRASFMTVPNAYLNQDSYPWYRTVCAAPPWLAIQDGVSPVAHSVWVREPTGGTLDYYAPSEGDLVLPGESPDQLVILGAFRADAPFRPSSMQSGSDRLTIPNGRFSEVDMQYMFNNAFVSVSTPAGGIQFLAIDSVLPGTTETILVFQQLLSADPTGTGLETCNFTGFGGATYEVVPLHFVRYSIVVDPEDPESTVLIREELNHSMVALDNTSRHIVARDIVDFQIWFDGIAAGAASNDITRDAETGTLVDTEGSMTTEWMGGSSTSRPEGVRFSYVQLSARLDTAIAREHPNPEAPMRRFVELQSCSEDGTCQASGEWARVVTSRSEVDLPNMHLANTRTDR
jgi:prepilin-type N-terminal cleavage/methylation domain-containing protein